MALPTVTGVGGLVTGKSGFGNQTKNPLTAATQRLLEASASSELTRTPPVPALTVG